MDSLCPYQQIPYILDIRNIYRTHHPVCGRIQIAIHEIVSLLQCISWQVPLVVQGLHDRHPQLLVGTSGIVRLAIIFYQFGITKCPNKVQIPQPNLHRGNLIFRGIVLDCGIIIKNPVQTPDSHPHGIINRIRIRVIGIKLPVINPRQHSRRGYHRLEQITLDIAVNTASLGKSARSLHG